MTRRALARLWLLCGRGNKREASFSLQAPNAFEGSALSYFRHAANMASMEMERCGLFPSKSPLDRIFSLHTVCVLCVAIFAIEFYLPDGNFYAARACEHRVILPVLWCPFFDDGCPAADEARERHTHGALNWPLFRFCPATLTYFPLKRSKE
jgi:hypothetical protein